MSDDVERVELNARDELEIQFAQDIYDSCAVLSRAEAEKLARRIVVELGLCNCGHTRCRLCCCD